MNIHTKLYAQSLNSDDTQQKSCPTKAFCVKTQVLFTAKLVGELEMKKINFMNFPSSTGHVNFIHCLMSLMLTSPWVSALFVREKLTLLVV